MSLTKDTIQNLGELLILGFSGVELSDGTANFIKKAGIGGTILFSHNYETPGQVAELCNSIQDQRRDLPLWISVDHEGGKVQRFKKGFTRIPEAATIAELGSPKLAFEVAQVMARELKAVGINLNFCPVADIATNPKNPVIGNRAFGTDEETVAKFCTAMVRGHLVNGVQPCVKHFPGHGDTSTDSHFALPAVDTPLETLQNREFIPFLKSFKSGCSMVMTAHVLIRSIDQKVPATLCSYLLRDILRKQLRYTKIVLSDDLEMKAITDHYGAEEAPKLALQAGCDLLIYRSEAATVQGYEALVRAVESGELAPEIVMESVKRARALKKECLLPYQPVTISDVGARLATSEHQAILQKMSEPVRPRF